MAEPIGMPFGGQTRVGSKNYALDHGTSVNSGIFLIRSTPRSDQGFSWIWKELMQARSIG